MYKFVSGESGMGERVSVNVECLDYRCGCATSRLVSVLKEMGYRPGMNEHGGEGLLERQVR